MLVQNIGDITSLTPIKKLDDSPVPPVENGGTSDVNPIATGQDQFLKLLLPVSPKIQQAKKYLGWEPKVGFKKGLSRAIEYFQSLL